MAVSKTDTWMPLYIGDYMADTMRLSTVEHGAYLLLIMEYWRQGPLPSDERVLAAIAKMDLRAWRKSVASTVLKFFVEADGMLHHKRIDAERTKANKISKVRREAAHSRHAKADANADATPMQLDLQKEPQLHSKSIHTRVVARQSPSPEETTNGFSQTARGGAPSETPRVGDPPERWAALAEGWEVQRSTGVKRPVVAGEYLDVLAGMVLDAARVDSATFRGNWQPLIRWLKSGLDGTAIVRVIETAAARPGYKPNEIRSLAYFDQVFRDGKVAA